MAAETGTGRLVAGRYSVTGVLGRGGMGVVWDATDEGLNRPAAPKGGQVPGPPAGRGRTVAGRCSVTGVRGRGGMGVVWDATDEVLNRPVALKEVQFPAHLTDEERADLRARTLREARTAARLVQIGRAVQQ